MLFPIHWERNKYEFMSSLNVLIFSLDAGKQLIMTDGMETHRYWGSALQWQTNQNEDRGSSHWKEYAHHEAVESDFMHVSFSLYYAPSTTPDYGCTCQMKCWAQICDVVTYQCTGVWSLRSVWEWSPLEMAMCDCLLTYFTLFCLCCLKRSIHCFVQPFVSFDLLKFIFCSNMIVKKSLGSSMWHF